MREIKFRAWDGKEIYENVVIVDGRAFKNEKFAGKPMQYTGLKDKDGREIYEGDVVDTTYDGSTFIGVVVYDLSELDFKATDGKEHYRQNFQYLPCCDEIEVIGNIYENPDLLEVKA